MFVRMIIVFTLLLNLASCIDVRLDLRMHFPKIYEHPVNLDVGSYFYVVLDENLSTGYHWESIDSNL